MRLWGELRARWRAWGAIALLIGVAGGAVLTAAAGARRTETAYPRFLRFARAADVVVSPQNTGLTGYYDALAKVDGVAALAPTVGIEVFATGLELANIQAVASPDRRYTTTAERPKIVKGRMYDPARVDEALADRNLARQYHLRVGSKLDVIAAPTTPKGPDLAHGRRMTIRIVGLAVTRDNPVAVNALGSQATLLTTPAFLGQFDPSVYSYDGAYIRLRPGTSRAAFLEQARALATRFPDTGSPLFVADEHQQAAKVDRAVRPQAIALGIFALLAALTSVFVVGQIMARQLFLASSDNPTLRSLGMSRADLIVLGLSQVALASTTGAVLAVIVAMAASPLTPIGPARIAEPYPGVAINWALLGGGALLIVGLLVAWVAWPAWKFASAPAGVQGPIESAGTGRPSRLVQAAARSGVPASATIGFRLALEPGWGSTAVPVRSAFAGTAFAVAAVAAAFTFGANLTRLVDTPRLYGQTWDVAVDTQFGQVPAPAADQFLSGQRGVTGWTFGDHGVVTLAGRDVPMVALTTGRGPELWPTLLEGRAPTSADEIVLGTKTLERIHHHLGETVPATVQGQPGTHPMRIVGRAVFPLFGAGGFTPTGLGEGAAVRDATPDPAGFNFFLVRFASRSSSNGAVIENKLRGMGVCPGDQVCGVFTAQRPVDINNYGRIRSTPMVLAGVLAVLAVVTLAHVLITSIRRRRRDLAILKTLGFLRGQVSSAVAWQATVLVGLALFIGLPAGVAAGRWVWMVFASRLGVAPDPRIPMTAVLLAVPAALAVANALAAGPGLVAGRLAPASVLRTE
jgi:hypothetical protein